LRRDVTLSQARAEVHSLSGAIAASYPTAIAESARRGQLTITATPFHEEVVGTVRALLLVLMAAVAFVLLICCANVATLLLSRAASRQREAAVRSALGATRFRLIRQMLTESLLLAFGAGALGLGLAYWGKDLILGFAPASVPLPRQVPLDGGVLAFVVVVSILTTVLFGLAPGLQISTATVQQRLQEGGRSGTAKGSHRLQRFFVTIEFGLALVLLTSAGLMIRSFAKLLETNPGFQTDHVLTLNVPLPRQAYPEAAQIQGFYNQLLDRVSNLPGVVAASLSNDLPLNGIQFVSMTAEASEGEEKTPEAICQSWVLGDYFHTMGIPLLQGRTFGPDDRLETQQVAIVSASLAAKMWPRQDPIGKRIRWGLRDPWATIVGVVGDIKQGPLNASSVPHVYRPYGQLPESFMQHDPFGDLHAMNLALRTHTEPASLTKSVLAQVHALDSALAATNVRTMAQVIRASVATSQFNMILLGAFACLALFLGAIGVYGVLGYAAARQTREIGIRMAMGARRSDVLQMVLGQGFQLTLVGVGIGILGALGITRFLESMLYGVKPTDPLTFVAVSLLLTAVALLACYIPARRATRVEPMEALRYE
jgi:putative ABC transport system permease protein